MGHRKNAGSPLSMMKFSLYGLHSEYLHTLCILTSYLTPVLETIFLLLHPYRTTLREWIGT